MAFSVYTTRIQNWVPGPVPQVLTLRDIGVLSHDCPFCPEHPEQHPDTWQESGPRFGAGDELRELLDHYLTHRTHHMQAGCLPPCPCCGAALRASYRPDLLHDAVILMLHPEQPRDVVLLQAELDHFLRGSLGVPADISGQVVQQVWPRLAGQFGFDEQGRLRFR